MLEFSQYLAQGNAWLFIPGAVVLGALHGLEPGHSKTMMSAFIIAIRGTVGQAFLLGLSAAISHTVIIWILAFVGLYYSSSLNVEELEPYFQSATGIVIIVIAVWMFYRTRQAQKAAHHSHGAHDGIMVDTGHGLVEISVFETDVPPRFRLHFYDAKRSPAKVSSHQTVTVQTVRPDGVSQLFEFESKEDYLEAKTELPEPHEFKVILELKHGGHSHSHRVDFTEAHHHHHVSNEDLRSGDAHERAHAAELEKRLAGGGQITTGQIILFGLTGGLLPCPSAFAVLLMCLQLKKVALGFSIVLAFSVGLAVTLVTVGMVAALSVKQAASKFTNLGELARKMPYVSSVPMTCIGVLVLVQGIHHLMR